MLERCPFCGGFAKYESLYAGYQQIMCTICGARSKLIQATLEKPIKEVHKELEDLWNRRLKNVNDKLNEVYQ